MKYLITESQSLIYRIIRRINEGEHLLMKEIINEGLNMYDPCQFTFEEFIRKILEGSSETLMFSYYELKLSHELWSELQHFIMEYMNRHFYKLIFNYYQDYC